MADMENASCCADAASIKTGRTISCHFENGFCGWTPDTVGNITWKRNKGNSPDRSSGIIHDHTFPDSNTISGYYVYTTGWNTLTSATLLSDVFTLSAPTNFTFCDLCGYTPISGQPATWVQIITKDPLHGIPPTTDGNYAYFKSNSINIHNGDTRSLVSPKLNINGCIDLEFYYILPYTDTMTLSIKLQESGKITLVKDITGLNMNKWLYTKINNICVTKNTQTLELNYMLSL
ncbi:hypothetical protein LOTGIDRAFT_158013 [Lottia gigantea]|uniref:MAM domain-containing protein n=1 Tax=Lottia gigantea TaxID=225164 RepID=V4A9Q3_LOTGI|nr:hypothetical protein LOTGIDRAFT_158013 [Lottia gigantea]ESP00719.1 hypothetical protein LOTGIDRAFT_158013 [Lottia gigantea]